MKKAFIIIIVLLLVCGGIVLLFTFVSNIHNDKRLGDIRPPVGYERVEAADNSVAAYMRSLPLKERGSHVYLHTGGKARLQWLSAAVVDLPTLSNNEQCADVCMRLHAEYLFSQGRYNDIRFTTLGGEQLKYTGGSDRKAFEKFMRNVYGLCNTTSLHRSLKKCELKDLQVGDVFVYPHRMIAGKDRMGHAVMVADVAVNKFTGRKAFMLVEGNTPARNIHVLRNFNPFHNSWFILDEDANAVQLNVFRFKADDLRRF